MRGWELGPILQVGKRESQKDAPGGRTAAPFLA